MHNKSPPAPAGGGKRQNRFADERNCMMKATKIAHIIATCILALTVVALGISLTLTISHLKADQRKLEKLENERDYIYATCKQPYTTSLKDPVTFETKLFKVGDSIEDVICTYGLPHERSYTHEKPPYVSSIQPVGQRYLTYIITCGYLEGYPTVGDDGISIYPIVKFTYSKDGVITAVDYFDSEEAYRASLS